MSTETKGEPVDSGCPLSHTVDLDATVTPGPGAWAELAASLQIHMYCSLKAETPSSGGDPRMTDYRGKRSYGSSLLPNVLRTSPTESQAAASVAQKTNLLRQKAAGVTNLLYTFTAIQAHPWKDCYQARPGQARLRSGRCVLIHPPVLQ